jgi:hypothetical protein
MVPLIAKQAPLFSEAPPSDAYYTQISDFNYTNWLLIYDTRCASCILARWPWRARGGLLTVSPPTHQDIHQGAQRCGGVPLVGGDVPQTLPQAAHAAPGL